MTFLKEILKFLSEMDILDLLDIALVWVLLYMAYTFIRERRAGKLAVGVVILFALQVLSEFWNLGAMKFILENVFQVGLIALIIVFQPELRSALEKVGGEPFRGIRNLTDTKDAQTYNQVIDNICEAVCDMSLDKTGALIVIERYTKLGEFIRSGTEINADISSYLLKNIFFNKAPLHDGAVIVRGTRIVAAGCFLPLSTNTDIVKDLGTRHRAAIGMSENSDAVVIVVSEETGVISIAKNGSLSRNYDYTRLHKELSEIMSEGTGKAAQRKANFIMKNKAAQEKRSEDDRFEEEDDAE